MAPRIFLSIENGLFFSPNAWQMMTFLNPLDALIPKIPFSFFARIFGSGNFRGPGVSLGRNLGVPSIFFGGGDGGSSQRAVSIPPPPRRPPFPPELKARPPLCFQNSAPSVTRGPCTMWHASSTCVPATLGVDPVNVWPCTVAWTKKAVRGRVSGPGVHEKGKNLRGGPRSR